MLPFILLLLLVCFSTFLIDFNSNDTLLIILTHSVAFVAHFWFLLEAEEVNDNNNCTPLDDTATFDEKILLSKSRPELKQLCSDYGLLVGGTKQTLINQLMDPQNKDYRKRSIGGQKKRGKWKAQTKEDQYYPHLRHFMNYSFHQGNPVEKGYQFSNNELYQITPDLICQYIKFKAYSNPNADESKWYLLLLLLLLFL